MSRPVSTHVPFKPASSPKEKAAANSGAGQGFSVPPRTRSTPLETHSQPQPHAQPHAPGQTTISTFKHGSPGAAGAVNATAPSFLAVAAAGVRALSVANAVNTVVAETSGSAVSHSSQSQNQSQSQSQSQSQNQNESKQPTAGNDLKAVSSNPSFLGTVNGGGMASNSTISSTHSATGHIDSPQNNPSSFSMASDVSSATALSSESSSTNSSAELGSASTATVGGNAPALDNTTVRGYGGAPRGRGHQTGRGGTSGGGGNPFVAERGGHNSRGLRGNRGQYSNVSGMNGPSSGMGRPGRDRGGRYVPGSNNGSAGIPVTHAMLNPASINPNDPINLAAHVHSPRIPSSPSHGSSPPKNYNINPASMPSPRTPTYPSSPAAGGMPMPGQTIIVGPYPNSPFLPGTGMGLPPQAFNNSTAHTVPPMQNSPSGGAPLMLSNNGVPSSLQSQSMQSGYAAQFHSGHPFPAYSLPYPPHVQHQMMQQYNYFQRRQFFPNMSDHDAEMYMRQIQQQQFQPLYHQQLMQQQQHSYHPQQQQHMLHYQAANAQQHQQMPPNLHPSQSLAPSAVQSIQIPRSPMTNSQATPLISPSSSTSSVSPALSPLAGSSVPPITQSQPSDVHVHSTTASLTSTSARSAVMGSPALTSSGPAYPYQPTPVFISTAPPPPPSQPRAPQPKKFSSALAIIDPDTDKAIDTSDLPSQLTTVSSAPASDENNVTSLPGSIGSTDEQLLAEKAVLATEASSHAIQSDESAGKSDTTVVNISSSAPSTVSSPDETSIGSSEVAEPMTKTNIADMASLETNLQHASKDIPSTLPSLAATMYIVSSQRDPARNDSSDAVDPIEVNTKESLVVKNINSSAPENVSPNATSSTSLHGADDAVGLVNDGSDKQHIDESSASDKLSMELGYRSIKPFEDSKLPSSSLHVESNAEESKELIDASYSNSKSQTHMPIIYNREFLMSLASYGIRPPEFPAKLPDQLVSDELFREYTEGVKPSSSSSTSNASIRRLLGTSQTQDVRSGASTGHGRTNLPSATGVRGLGGFGRSESSSTSNTITSIPSRGDRISRGSTQANTNASGPSTGFSNFDMNRHNSSGQIRGNDRDRDRDRSSGERELVRRPLPPPAPEQNPFAQLKKSDSPWQAGQDQDNDMERVRKRFLSLMNKLTLDKFDVIASQIIELIRGNVSLGPELLDGIVSVLFDKAVDESYFSAMYSNLCVLINEEAGGLFDTQNQEAAKPPPTPSNVSGQDVRGSTTVAGSGTRSLFKTTLLKACQDAFYCGNTVIDQSQEDYLEQIFLQKRRMLGNIKFIGELYKKNLLREKIMHECVNKLLPSSEAIKSNDFVLNEEYIEALCNLLTNVGPRLDAAKNKEKIDQYFIVLESLLKPPIQISSRIRFMILDEIDLRKNKWIPRNKKAEAKSKEQVRVEEEAEANAKQQALYGRPYNSGNTNSAGIGANRFVIKSIPDSNKSTVPQAAGFKTSQPSTSVQTSRPDRYSYTQGASSPSISILPRDSTSTSSSLPLSLAPQGKSLSSRNSASGEKVDSSSSTLPSQVNVKTSRPHSNDSKDISSPSAANRLPTSSPTSNFVAFEVDDKTLSRAKSMVNEFLDNKDLRKELMDELKKSELNQRIAVVTAAVRLGGDNSKHIKPLSGLLLDFFENKLLDRSSMDSGLSNLLKGIDDDYMNEENRNFAPNVATFSSILLLQNALSFEPFLHSSSHLTEWAPKILDKLIGHLLDDKTGLNVEDVADLLELASFSSAPVPKMFADGAELHSCAKIPNVHVLFPLVFASESGKWETCIQKALSVDKSEFHSQIDSMMDLLLLQQSAANSIVYFRNLQHLLLSQPSMGVPVSTRSALMCQLLQRVSGHASFRDKYSNLLSSPIQIISLIRASYTFCHTFSHGFGNEQADEQFGDIITALAPALKAVDNNSLVQGWRHLLVHLPVKWCKDAAVEKACNTLRRALDGI